MVPAVWRRSFRNAGGMENEAMNAPWLAPPRHRCPTPQSEVPKGSATGLVILDRGALGGQWTVA